MKHSAFALIYCTNNQPWINYETDKEIINSHKHNNIPYIFAIHRWDGTFGLPGGGVHENEEIESSLRRELREEIHYFYEDEFVKLSEYQYKNQMIHVFGIHVSFNEIKEIMKSMINAVHFGSEIIGSILIPIIQYDNIKGLNSSLNHNFAGELKSDIVNFIKENNLL